MNNYTFNFENGKPIGIIKKGKYNNEIIYIDENKNENKKKIEVDDMEILRNNFFNNIKGTIKSSKLDKLNKYIKNNIEPEENDIKELYLKAKNKIEKTKNKEIILTDEGKIMPIFDPNEEFRSVNSIVGMSGCGKSFFASMLIDSYNKLFPENKVYLFSNKDYDENLDSKKIVRIDLNDELIDDPLKLNDLENSCVVFDDIEFIPNKKISHELDRLRDLILQQGRSYKINFIYIHHLANNYSKTKTILNELHSITFFPAMTTKYSLKYLLEKYFGFDKENIKKIYTLPSRWVTIKKSPFIVIHEKGCYLIN